MRIGYFQFEVRHKNPEANLQLIESSLTGKRYDLLVLPELCTSGYIFQNRADLSRYAESIPDGRTVLNLTRLCQQNRSHIIAGLPERCGQYLYNTAVLIGPDGYIGSHRKLVLSRYEKTLFDRGQECRVFEVAGVKIGLAICLESWMPEISRYLMRQGCQILCNPSSFGGTMTISAIRTRAIENMFFTITANRLGEEYSEGIQAYFCGGSCIHDINGHVLIRTGKKSNIALIDIEPRLATYRQNDIFELDEELATLVQCLNRLTDGVPPSGGTNAPTAPTSRPDAFPGRPA